MVVFQNWLERKSGGRKWKNEGYGANEGGG